MKMHKGRTKGGRRHIQMLDSKPGRLNAERQAMAQQIRINLGLKTDAMRRHFGLTVPQLAAALGWTSSEVAKLIAGEMQPSKGQHADLSRWAKACALSKEVKAE